MAKTTRYHCTVATLRAWVELVERPCPIATLGELHGAKFDFRGGAYTMQLGGVTGTSTNSREAARDSWLRVARRKLGRAEAEADPINLHSSGPASIVSRES